MNEQLQNTVNEILQKAIAGATQAGEFLKDQIPDVVQQLLTWKLTESAVEGVGCVVGVVALGIAYKKFCKLIARMDTDYFARSLAGAFSGGGVVVLSVASLSNLLEVLKIWLAPKVWLLEYAASLVKGH